MYGKTDLRAGNCERLRIALHNFFESVNVKLGSGHDGDNACVLLFVESLLVLLLFAELFVVVVITGVITLGFTEFTGRVGKMKFECCLCLIF